MDRKGTYQWWLTRKNAGSCTRVYDFAYSTSWVRASALYTYLVHGSAGWRQDRIYSWRTDDSYSAPTNYNSRLRLGDIVFYDWNGDGSINHAAIVTLTKGKTSDGYTASGVSYHTADKKDTSWNLSRIKSEKTYRNTRIHHFTRN